MIQDKQFYHRSLHPFWQQFVDRCVQLGFGEIQNLDIKEGQIIRVGNSLKMHSAPWTPSQIDLTVPLSKHWGYLITLCESIHNGTIQSVKIENAQPVNIRTPEGGWSPK